MKKYELKFWGYWPVYFRLDVIRWYYKIFHKLDVGIRLGVPHSYPPITGKGQFVSVYQKGKIIQIIAEDIETYGYEIRIIPNQANHGVMVERWKDGNIYGSIGLDIQELNKLVDDKCYRTQIENALEGVFE